MHKFYKPFILWVNMTKYKVSVDEKKCIGCGACASVCSEVFEMKEIKGESKSIVKKKRQQQSAQKKQLMFAQYKQ